MDVFESKLSELINKKRGEGSRITKLQQDNKEDIQQNIQEGSVQVQNDSN